MCAREGGGQRRMASFQRGAAECFTVMDVPHGGPASDSELVHFGTQWGGRHEQGGCLGAPFSTESVEKRLCERFIHLGKGMTERCGERSFYSCSECSKNGKLGLPGLPLHLLPHNYCS